MKILHLQSGDLSGGAARGAYWLHRALSNNGVKSLMLISRPPVIVDESIFSVSSSKIGRIKSIFNTQLDVLPLKLYKNKENVIFSTGLAGIDITRHDLYKWADIIHVHWINKGFISIRHLNKIKKPIVWTMRDMWAMTGGCHCSMTCTRYNTGCGFCPILKSGKKNDLSRFVVNLKKRIFPKNISLVGISNWLSKCAQQSYLFKDYDIFTIFNGIDINEFSPVDKQLARDILNIKTKKKIILASISSANDLWKGFNYFVDSLNFIAKSKYFFLFFGRNFKDERINDLGIEFQHFGHLNDNISLKLLYSASDVFIFPSVQEGFGKMIIEAMACGTPVVCFDATGPMDIVTHKVDGYKAMAFNVHDFGNGITWILENENRNNLCLEARNKVLTNFDINNIAFRYIDLYRNLLQKKAGQQFAG